ncbi:DUF2865 domain-containing protein [Methylobacterium sp. Leaf118]|uniref:DUF2865 domain-containing protein n=1 Tax=Methylobacterium sp. Leaf118 TaxID=2876562 RepID=UPI0022B7C48A|nr:DUF2865 domain-containing protein [Methylobacterium sp. Leaf118]
MRPPAPRRTGPASRGIVLILLGLVLGFGGVVLGAPVVRASERGGLAEFFDALFGVAKPAPPPAAPVAMPRKTPRRYSALPDARTLGPPRPARQTPRLQARVSRPLVAQASVAPSAGLESGTRTVCVRLCDGYLFPVGRLRNPVDLPVHQAACAASCPGARTGLYTLAPGRGEMEEAVGLDGRPYLGASWANLYRRTRVAHCACQPDRTAGPLLSIADDRTVRAGDVVATADSADVVTRVTRQGLVMTDYRDAAIGEGRRRAIEGRVGALRREADEAAFRRSLRLAEHRVARIRTAEAQVARLRMEGAGFGLVEAGPAGASFAPVRVVAPSPFER